MKVIIEYERILIGENALEYYPYYFGIWNRDIDYRITIKNVLAQWASALATLNGSRSEVYLPYYLDDQICRFLKAESDGGRVVLTDVEVADDGWAMNLDNLGDRMYTEPEIIGSYVDYFGNEHKDTSKPFGWYSLNEVIEALRAAEIGDA